MRAVRIFSGLGAIAPLLLASMLWPVAAPCCASGVNSEAAFTGLDCCSQSAEDCQWTAAGPVEATGAISNPARLAVAAADKDWPPRDRPLLSSSALPTTSPPKPHPRLASVLRI